MIDESIGQLGPFCRMLSKKLLKLGLKTINDLFFYYPFRYDDLSKIKLIEDLIPGETATIKIRIELIKNYRSPYQHKKITEAIGRDYSGKIKILWFNQWYLSDIIKPGEEFFIAGKINDSYGKEIISPDYERADKEPVHTARIIPVYPLTRGLSQKQLRTVIKMGLNFLNKLEDYLPEEIISGYQLIDLKSAIANIHFPENQELIKKAVHRLSFDELFLTQLKNLMLKKDLRQRQAPGIKFNKEKISEFTNNLPFELTDAQKKAALEIVKDMEEMHPMNRLLNGDVGSGKTLVAAIGMYNAALSGWQSALLAPTEILARQHYDTFCKLFSNSGMKIGLVTRNTKMINNPPSTIIPDARAKRAQYSSFDHELTTEWGIQKNELDSRFRGNDSKSVRDDRKIIENSDIVIGTHALIQEDIQFKNLALVVVDEQHRFGVEQRAKLSSQSIGNLIFPHLLSMTATPIPRTLAIISYGDLDLSVLDQMPAERKPTKTFVVPAQKRIDAYGFIRKEISAGRQVFVVCPLIDESDKLGVKSVTEEYKRLENKIFPCLKIAMLHGKLKTNEKNEIMEKFKNNEINILVSTSVVEVGVDIPNATIMMIEGAERFGLAQLHQFRGRVGRGAHQSYCLLFPTDAPTSRLKAMEKINDGFQLAEIDLELRGSGKIFGTEQSGKFEFKLADTKNIALIKQSSNAAKNIISSDPKLENYPKLKKYLEGEMEKVHLE